MKKNGVNFKIPYKSSELFTDFNNKTQVTTEQLEKLQFSIIELREKLTQDHTDVNCPIITQVTAVNTALQVKVNIYSSPNLAGERSGDISIRR